MSYLYYALYANFPIFFDASNKFEKKKGFFYHILCSINFFFLPLQRKCAIRIEK